MMRLQSALGLYGSNAHSPTLLPAMGKAIRRQAAGDKGHRHPDNGRTSWKPRLTLSLESSSRAQDE